MSAICCMVAPPQYALEVITAVIMGAWLVWLQPPMDSADRSSTGSVHKAWHFHFSRALQLPSREGLFRTPMRSALVLKTPSAVRQNGLNLRGDDGRRRLGRRGDNQLWCWDLEIQADSRESLTDARGDPEGGVYVLLWRRGRGFKPTPSWNVLPLIQAGSSVWFWWIKKCYLFFMW